MNVTLLDYTGAGDVRKEGQMIGRKAAELLVFTKNTRLKMTAGGLEDLSFWSDEGIMEELKYMADTIPSSWEFVNYTFMVEGVTRAFTHQLVRTRTQSYAQQTMRILDVSGFEYLTGPSIEGDEDLEGLYHDTMATLEAEYSDLIESGAAIEDARGVLPTNILTNIAVGTNLRVLAETVSKRSSSRTQGEYQDYVQSIKDEVLKVHPWAELFLNSRKVRAAAALEEFISDVHGSSQVAIKLIKQVDMLRG